MGRPRKPTAHLELVGAFRKNPQRTRDSEPVCAESVVLPPYELGERAQMAWDYLCRCAVPGVLTKMDSAFLALCASGLAAVWFDEEATIQDLKAVGSMLGKLGMTPAERSNVVVPKSDKPNVFANFRKA